MSGPSPHVTVIVVARNEERRIGKCMASLAEQDYPDFSVILVDDGSTDSTITRAREAFPTARIISNPTRSISQNREAGWRSADSEFIAYLDADCSAPTHWLSALVNAARKTDAAAVGGGNCPPQNESPHYSALALVLDTYIGSRGSVQGKVPSTGHYVPHLPGLNVMYRREALELVGGFDPRFARMGEDEDLSRRLGDIGLRLWVTPEATVVHRQRTDLVTWTRNMRGYGRGRTWLMRRHPNSFSPLFLLPPSAMLALPLYLLTISLYAVWVSLRAGRPFLWPRILALFVSTHLAYGLGQIEGLFILSDNAAWRQKRDRVALLVLKNAGNKGDEAICACIANHVTSALPDGNVDLYLGAIGPSGFDIRPVPSDPRAQGLLIADMLAPSADSRSIGQSAVIAIPRLFFTIRGFRAMVIAGGQWLHDLSVVKHIAVCSIFAMARLCRTRTGAFCIGAGPLYRTFSKKLLRFAFSRSSLLIARDENSTSLLRACGFKQAITATDPAIELQSNVVISGSGKILLSPCAWSSFQNIYARDPSEIDANLAQWHKLIGKLLNCRETVAILPTMNPEDTSFAARLISRIDGIEIINTDEMTPAQVQGCIASAKALISMRLHPVIFASNTGTPFVALNYASKVRAFCEQSGQSDRLVELDDPDWADRVLKLLGQAMNISQASVSRQHQLKLLSAAYFQFLDWLRTGHMFAWRTVRQTA